MLKQDPIESIQTLAIEERVYYLACKLRLKDVSKDLDQILQHKLIPMVSLEQGNQYRDELGGDLFGTLLIIHFLGQ